MASGSCDTRFDTTINEWDAVRNIRLIARLDIKGANLIKGIHLEGLRIMGSPGEHAVRYYLQGVDELIYMDCVASLYGRNHLGDIVRSAAKDIFVPMTVGGGIRSVDNAMQILRAGADKVAVNTAAVAKPQLITEIARHFGSQCMVLSIEAKQVGPERWEVYTDNSREGTRKGFDIALVRAVTAEVSVPVIASGGMGKLEDLLEVVREGGADAVAMADILHYKRAEIGEIRTMAEAAGLGVRRYECE
jgi:cyclase